MNVDYLLVAVFAAIACTGAWLDIRTRRIPNALNGIFALAGLAAVGATGSWQLALWALAHFAVALAIGMVAFRFGLWGGGDGKFYAATAAWFPLAEFPRLIVAISIGGLLLLFCWFTVRRIWRSTVSGIRGQLPYGVAIAGGGIAVAVITRLLGG